MGELKDHLRADMTAAMKARDAERRDVLRMALSAIGVAEVAGDEARALSQDEERAVLTREVNQRKDSAEAYSSGGRPELAEKELAEAAILAQYLPSPLSDDELGALVDDEVAAAAAAAGGEVTMRQMGQVIKAVNARAAGRAQGAQVAALVKARLQRT